MKTISPARALWKLAWRQMRVNRREMLNAADDAIRCGYGFIVTGSDTPDGIRRIDPRDVFTEAA